MKKLNKKLITGFFVLGLFIPNQNENTSENSFYNQEEFISHNI